ncbi:hypothetical protein AQI84_03695 [Streptomyces griseorubiginosus]|nr:hypothetical protein AQI84_03695 [Streptomyces griseorubiginosus]
MPCLEGESRRYGDVLTRLPDDSRLHRRGHRIRLRTTAAYAGRGSRTTEGARRRTTAGSGPPLCQQLVQRRRALRPACVGP